MVKRRFALPLGVLIGATLVGCAPTDRAPSPSVSSVTPSVEVSSSSTASVEPPAPLDAWTTHALSALAVEPAGYDWIPAIGQSTALDVIADVDAVYVGNVTPAACVDARRASRLVVASDLAAGDAGAQAVITLGRSAADGPEPEIIRARVLPDEAAAIALHAQLVAALEACPVSEYRPDVHYREVVSAVTVEAATIGDRPATRVTWADRAVFLDGIRQSTWSGPYLGAYVFADRGAVFWLEYNVRAGMPTSADVEAFVNALAASRGE